MWICHPMAAGKPLTVKLAAFSAAMFFLWTLAAGNTESPRRIEITAKKFAFDPAEITVKVGEPVVLVMHSIDVTHGLELARLHIKAEEIKKKKKTEIKFTPQEVGHYVGLCAHFCGPGHGAMRLQINVVP
jgi:cytochrome c oxidase subunit II